MMDFDRNNLIRCVLAEDDFWKLEPVLITCRYWTNTRGNTYTIYGLPLEVQFELEKSHFTTYDSQLG